MAESYRGLTIRIGGDTSKLSRALKAANSSISGTQNELRKLGQALKLDPGNIVAYNLQMGYMANQATNTAMKLSQMQSALEEVGKRNKVNGVAITDDDGNVRTVQELARATEEFSGDVENASLRAAQARSEFNQLVATLGTMHNEVTELSSRFASIESEKFAKAFELSTGKKSIQEIRDELQKAFDGISTSDLEKRIEEIKGLAATFDFDSVFNLKDGTVSVDAINDAISKIPEQLRPGQKSVDEFIAKLKEMNSEYGESRAELAKIEEARKKALDANDDKFAENLGTRFARLGQQYREAMEGIEDETEKAKVADKFTEKFQSAFMKLESSSSTSADRIGKKYDAQIDKALKKSEDVIESIRSRYNDARSELTDISGTVFNFDSKNTDPKQLQAALDEMRQSLEGMASELGISDNEIKAFIDNVSNLQSKFMDADTELKKWNLVQEFQDLVSETVKGEASISQLSRAIADMKQPSDLMRGMYELVETSKVLEESYRSLMGIGKELSSAIKLNPSDSTAAEQAMKAYAAAELVAVENANALQQKLAGFDASKIGQATDHTKSATKQLLDASKSAEEANTAYAKAQGNVERLNNLIGILDGKADEVLKSVGEEAFENLKNAADITSLEEARQELARYEAEVAKLGQTRREALADLDLAKQRKEYDDATAGAAKWTAAILEARKAQVELSKESAIASAFGDTTEIDKLGEGLETAAQRAKSLNTLLEHDPKNMELRTAKIQAFADVESIAEKRTEAINQKLENINTKAIDEMRSKYTTAANAMAQTENAAGDLAKNVEAARQKLNALTSGKLFDGVRDDIRDTSKEIGFTLPSNIQAARDELVRLEAAFKAALGDVDDAAVFSFFEKLQREIEETRATAEGAKVTPTIDDAAYQQVISRIGQVARQVVQEVKESANTIDSAYRDMRKTVNASEQAFEDLRDEAIAFSQVHAVSSDTILEIESLGGQLGLAASSLQEFGETISNMDIATDMEAEELALKMGQLQNVMDDFDDTQFENAADSVVRLGNNMAAQESSIINIAQRMSSVWNTAKMSTPDLLAFSASIAATGQRSESAATAISNTVNGIASAVASGGDDLKGFASIAGMSADEFAQAWETRPAEALKAFIVGLEGLSDSNTAAVAALENMGISSVRQENALLGLAATIDTIDDAIEMSTDAWEGIGDEWGQAGDAAREAQNKSEGFSGSLAIIQNNADNLAASLGDGMIPFMNALAGVLSVVTDALNSMPGPLKTSVVEFGALAVAAGLLTATLKGLGFDATISGLTTLVAAEGAATLATDALVVALDAIPVIGWIAAAATAVNALAGHIGNAISDTELLRSATTELEDSVSKMGEAYARATDNTKSLEEMRDETNATLQAMVDFGNKMDEVWTKVGTDSGTAEVYASTIKELGNQGNITESNLVALKNAISEYNSITGSAIQITDENTGALSLNADAIDEVTEAYKQQAEAQAYIELYNDAIRQRIENEEKLKQAKEELAEAEETWGLRIGEHGFLLGEQMDKYRELERRVKDYEEVLKTSEDIVSDYEAHINGATYAFDDMDAALTAAGLSVDEFSGLTDDEKRKLAEIESALKSAGDSLRNYGSLNATQLAQIAAAWKGNATDIVSTINSIKRATSEAAVVKVPSSDDVSKYQKDQEAAYKQAKKDRDADYKSAQKSYDAIYKARQKELDKEYKAASKASQQYLKEFKKAQDEEVEAFKAATDAKIDEIDREYKAKEELLDLEYNQYDSKFDEQIAAIEAEQDAEDKARKQRQRQEKLDELNEKVSSARTNKARKDAEKELADYIADLTAEDTKAQRDAQIQKLKDQKSALKEQLSDRKEELKESYDLAVSSYKAEREAELKMLQESQDAAYEMVSEAESAKLEAIKEGHAQELENLKETHSSALELMKERHENELEQIKTDQEAALELYKAGGEAIEQAVDETSQAISDKASETATTVEDVVKGSLGNVLKMLSENGMMSKDAYLRALSQLPGSMSEIFEETGLATSDGAKEVARLMCQAGDIGYGEYLAILNNMPGATQAIANETGIALAAQIGVFGDDVRNASQGLVDNAKYPMDTLESIARENANKFAAQLASVGSKENADKAYQSSNAIKQSMVSPFVTLPKDGEAIGGKLPLSLASGIDQNANTPIRAANEMGSAVVRQLDISEGTGALGRNAAMSWNNGFVEWANEALENVRRWAASVVGAVQTTHQIHSPSRKFAWLAEMALRGYNQGWQVAEDGTLRMVSNTAKALEDSLEPGNRDLTKGLVDSLRIDEDALRTQVQRMAEIVGGGFDNLADSAKLKLLEQSRMMANIIEEGFDPRLSLESAYQAIDKIDAGELRKQQRIAASQSVDNSTYAPVININIPEIVVREEADIDRISQQIALRVQRQLNSRIG